MKRGRVLRAVLIGAAMTLGGSVLAPSARADIISFDLPFLNISGFTGPFASVEVNRTSTTTATITFTSLSNGGNTYLMGGQAAADVNVNGTYTLGTVTPTNSIAGFTAPSFVSNTPGQVDGFGNFNLSLNLFDGFTQAANKIVFTLTDTGAPWASAGSVLTPNASGFLAAAHIFVCANPCTASAGAVATGFAAVPGPVVGAGLPGGLVIACCGLLALARRRREKIV